MEVLALKMKNNIEERRKARGLRQEDMASCSGIAADHRGDGER
ncbi:MAG: hypothetical protein ACLT4C_09920 [Butyricicoccus sp.]